MSVSGCVVCVFWHDECHSLRDAQHANADWCVGRTLLSTEHLPDDDTSVPTHVGVV